MSRLLLSLLALLALSCPAQPGTDDLEPVEIAGRRFRLELVADPESRALGLMGRESLPADGGMLFVFPALRPRHFWMGNVPIDLDLAFLDDEGHVLTTHAMKAEPPQEPAESGVAYRGRMPLYASGHAARFAIELRAGTLGALGVAPGDRVELDTARLRALAR